MIRIGIIWFICSLCVAAVVLFTYFWQMKAVTLANFWLTDRVLQFGHSAEVNEDLVLLGIDDQTLSLQQDPKEPNEHPAISMMRSRPPFSREVYAMAIERVLEAGAKLVILDVLFPGASDEDDVLRAVLDKYQDRVVIGYELTVDKADGIGGTRMIKVNYPSDTLVEHSLQPDTRIGFVSLKTLDNKVRNINLATTFVELSDPGAKPSRWEPVHYSLVGRVLQKLGHDELLENHGDIHFRFADMDKEVDNRKPYAPRSFYGIFHPRLWEANFDSGELLKDKVVFIGAATPRLNDTHNTARGEMYGVQIHMNALAASIAEDFYENAGENAGIASIVIAGILAFVLMAFIRRPVLKLVLLFGTVFVFFVFIVCIFNWMDLVLPVAPPIMTCLAGGILAFGFDFALERRNELRLRRTLVRYTSRELVSEILENRDEYQNALRGTERELTVLFSDIRKFTSLTEILPPRELVTQVNEYFGEMVQAVFENRGTIDKFIGDAVMAVWGSVRSDGPATDARNAVSSALSMIERVEKLNDKWVQEEQPRPPFEIGIGINLGTAIFANIGSPERSDPTVMGDAINLASRVEGLTKYYRCAIIISESVREQVAEEFNLRRVDRVRVENRQEPAEVYSVLGKNGQEGIASSPPSWDDGLDAYWSRDFKKAEELFLKCGEELPDDHLAALFLERTRNFLENPPGMDWDGVAMVGK